MRLLLIILFLMMPVNSFAATGQEPMTEEELADRQRKIETYVERLRSGYYILVEKGINFLKGYGKDAVPELVKVASDRSNEKIYRLNAIYALGRLGADAHTSIPILMRLAKVGDDDYKIAVVGALGRMRASDNKVLITLKGYLKSESQAVRQITVNALEMIGSRKAKALLQAYATTQLEDLDAPKQSEDAGLQNL